MDHGAAIPADAEMHLQHCARCREFFEGQRAVVSGLTRKTVTVEPPPFLRTRILNAVRQTERKTGRLDLRWVAATVAVALITALIVTRSEPERQPARTLNLALNTDLFETKVVVQAANLENPLEAEFQNLENDTRNAARALAASFLPSTDR